MAMPFVGVELAETFNRGRKIVLAPLVITKPLPLTLPAMVLLGFGVELIALTSSMQVVFFLVGTMVSPELSS